MPAPQEPVIGPDGAEMTLADFRGRVVLLNFWATWCAPCVREMPSLDRLQAALGPEGLTVVAVSEDRQRERAASFLVEHDLDNLELYHDPRGKLARTMKLRGLPATFLLDRSGRILGSLHGPAEWDSDEAKALIGWYLDWPEQALKQSD